MSDFVHERQSGERINAAAEERDAVGLCRRREEELHTLGRYCGRLPGNEAEASRRRRLATSTSRQVPRTLRCCSKRPAVAHRARRQADGTTSRCRTWGSAGGPIDRRRVLRRQPPRGPQRQGVASFHLPPPKRMSRRLLADRRRPLNHQVFGTSDRRTEELLRGLALQGRARSAHRSTLTGCRQ